MNKKVEVFYDYGSTYSYIANSQLKGLQERTGCEIIFRPMLLGGVFKDTGNVSPVQNPVSAKVQYSTHDLMQWINYYGLEFTWNPNFPVNTILIMRIATYLADTDEFDHFHQGTFKAMWTEGLNLGDPEVVHAHLKSLGLDADATIEGALAQDNKDKLKATTDEAVSRGTFGAPTFYVGDQMFFGNDRLVLVEDALK